MLNSIDMSFYKLRCYQNLNFSTNLKISAVGLMTEGFSIFPKISEMTIQGVYGIRIIDLSRYFVRKFLKSRLIFMKCVVQNAKFNFYTTL